MKRTRKFTLGNGNEHDNTWRYGEFSLKQIDSEVEKEIFYKGKLSLRKLHRFVPHVVFFLLWTFSGLESGPLGKCWKNVNKQRHLFTRYADEADEEQQELTKVWKKLETRKEFVNRHTAKLFSLPFPVSTFAVYGFM